MLHIYLIINTLTVKKMSLNRTSYMSHNSNPNDESEITKMEITINVNDLDISQLTSDVMVLNNDIGNSLMHVFKMAHQKGLKSGYVLGYKEGLENGKEEGFQIGKKEGIRKGKLEGKTEYMQYMSNIDDNDEDCNYMTPITAQKNSFANSNSIGWNN